MSQGNTRDNLTEPVLADDQTSDSARAFDADMPDAGPLYDEGSADPWTIVNHFRGTPRSTLGSVYRDVTRIYLDGIDPTAPPEPKLIEGQLLLVTKLVMELENAKLEKHERKHLELPYPKTLAPVQVAMIAHHLHRIAEVTPSGADSDDDLGLLAMYQEEGEFAGLYRRMDKGLLPELGRRYNFTNDKRWFSEFERALRELAPRVTETGDPDLVVLKNLIYNYRTDERIPFSPDYVFISRNLETDLIDRQHPRELAQVRDADGSVIWDYEEWWTQVAPDPGTRLYLQQVIGATFRPNNDWQRMPGLFNEEGSNGKGTIFAHIRAMVGERNSISLPINKYGSQFGKQQIIGAHVNLPDETQVGDFIKETADLKSIITNDPIYVDRKNRDPITYKPSMFTILSLNGSLNFSDKSDSMYRRLAIVPMTQRFDGQNKNGAIKKDYLLRRGVCEYMVYKLLVEMPKYWVFEEPEAVKKALTTEKRRSSTVLSFWAHYGEDFVRPFLPFPMLFALYRAHLRATNPQSRGVNEREFTKELKAAVVGGDWMVPTIDGPEAEPVDRRLTTRNWLIQREHVLDEYHFDPNVAKWQYAFGDYDFPSLGTGVPRQTRGLANRFVYDEWVANGSAGDESVRAAMETVRLRTNAALALHRITTSEPPTAA